MANCIELLNQNLSVITLKPGRFIFFNLNNILILWIDFIPVTAQNQANSVYN